MWVINIISALVFLILGLIFSQGKGAFLIAGYNTASKEKKATYDEIALCKFMGKVMFSYAVCFLIMATSELFNSMVPIWIGWALFFCITICTLIYSNTGNRFRK